MKLLSLRLLCFLVVGGYLLADDLQWGGTYLAAWSGFGTSPYTAIDLSNNNKILTIFCLDFNDEIAPPMQWTANIHSLTASNVQQYAQFGGNYGQGVAGAPFGITAAPFAFAGDAGTNSTHSVNMSASSTAYLRYLEASWLFSNILAAQPNDVNTAIISQVAAWDLFVESKNLGTLTTDIKNYNGSTTYTFNNYLYSANHYSSAPTTSSLSGLQFQDAVDEALKAAQNAIVNQGWATSGYSPSWETVTGDPNWVANVANGTPVQEFLTEAPVPEPSAFILLGTVIGAWYLAKRRKPVALQAANSPAKD